MRSGTRTVQSINTVGRRPSNVMNTHVIRIGFCLLLLPLLARGEDDRPALKESPAKLVGLIETMAKENVASARINVSHMILLKRG